MPNTSKLRRRIKSVKNTSQITKAMQMVAATKMRRAQHQALTQRPYNIILSDSLKRLLPKLNFKLHQLLQQNDSKNISAILLTTDKSLCGALNTNLFKAVQSFVKDHPGKEISFYTLGKKGRQFLIKTGRTLEADFENHEVPTFRSASQIAKLLTQSFLTDKIGQAYIIYPHFASTLRQEAKVVKLLPIDPNALTELDITPQLNTDSTKKSSKSDFIDHNSENEVIFEPNLNDLLDYILNHKLQIQIYQSMLETKASEHSARMIAMQNATNNAKELVQDLQLSYNQIRQSSITTELLEITSAQAALE